MHLSDFSLKELVLKTGSKMTTMNGAFSEININVDMKNALISAFILRWELCREHYQTEF